MLMCDACTMPFSNVLCCILRYVYDALIKKSEMFIVFTQVRWTYARHENLSRIKQHYTPAIVSEPLHRLSWNGKVWECNVMTRIRLVSETCHSFSRRLPNVPCVIDCRKAAAACVGRPNKRAPQCRHIKFCAHPAVELHACSFSSMIAFVITAGLDALSMIHSDHRHSWIK